MRLPRSQAIVSKTPTESSLSYGEVLARAKASINLAELGINGVKPKYAVTEALILRVAEEGARDKADVLAGRLQDALSSAKIAGCLLADGRVGPIQKAASGLGSVWAQCPVPAGQVVVEARRPIVGWPSAIEAIRAPKASILPMPKASDWRKGVRSGKNASSASLFSS